MDTPTLLNEGLPRAIPSLEEVKVESVREETQICGGEFQDPPQLVQGKPAYVFTKSFYYSSRVSYGRKIRLKLVEKGSLTLQMSTTLQVQGQTHHDWYTELVRLMKERWEKLSWSSDLVTSG